MRQGATRSINSSATFPSVWLVAASVCLCPAAAQAQTNTAVGQGALDSITSGTFNTAYGFFALNKTTTGRYNTASGSSALLANTTGRFNTASGYLALLNNITGWYNTASGNGALAANDSGWSNTASGDRALTANTNGSGNTASGALALLSNTTGTANTADGHYALYSNTTGSNNTASGYATLRYNTTGRENVAVGAAALTKINGSYNVALGPGAGERTTAGNHNIYIGHPGINGSESRVMRIGRAQTKTFVDGIAGVPLSGATVVVRSNGQLGVVASSARYKQDIKPLGGAAPGMAEKLAQLRPVSFRYTGEPEARHYGLIAEEVERVMPELVVRDGEKRPDSVQYLALIPLLLQQWKAQQAEIAQQRALIEQQQAALTELRRMLATRFAARDAADKGDRADGR